MRVCYCVKSWTGYYDVERCEERDHWMTSDPIVPSDPLINVKDDLFVDYDPIVPPDLDPLPPEDDLFIDHDPIMPEGDPDPIMPSDPKVDMKEILGYEGPTFDTETHR